MLFALLVGETGVPGENTRPSASHWQILSHNLVSSTPRHGRVSNTHCSWWYTLTSQVIVSSTKIRSRTWRSRKKRRIIVHNANTILIVLLLYRVHSTSGQSRANVLRWIIYCINNNYPRKTYIYILWNVIDLSTQWINHHTNIKTDKNERHTSKVWPFNCLGRGEGESCFYFYFEKIVIKLDRTRISGPGKWKMVNMNNLNRKSSMVNVGKS